MLRHLARLGRFRSSRWLPTRVSLKAAPLHSMCELLQAWHWHQGGHRGRSPSAIMPQEHVTLIKAICTACADAALKVCLGCVACHPEAMAAGCHRLCCSCRQFQQRLMHACMSASALHAQLPSCWSSGALVGRQDSPQAGYTWLLAGVWAHPSPHPRRQYYTLQDASPLQPSR